MLTVLLRTFTKLERKNVSTTACRYLVTEDEVIDAIGCLTPHKSDSSGISTDLLRNAASVVSECVAALFTAIIRHG